jgi:hypothetical protein
LASELAFLQPLDAWEQTLLAGLLAKPILGIEGRATKKDAGVSAP